jgi:hypothetical protein
MSDEQSAFELEPVELYRISNDYKVDTYEIPYRIALNTFLNNILILDTEHEEDI